MPEQPCRLEWRGGSACRSSMAGSRSNLGRQVGIRELGKGIDHTEEEQHTGRRQVWFKALRRTAAARKPLEQSHLTTPTHFFFRTPYAHP